MEKAKVKPMYFEDFEIGQTLLSDSRTIKKEDIQDFARLSGDYNPLHVNEEYAKSTVHGGIIAHGALTYAITTGLHNSIGHTDDTTVGFLGLSMDMRKAVKPGDTLHVVVVVKGKRLTSKPGRGIVTFSVNTLNQNDEVVLEATWKIMFKCRAQ